MTSASTTTISDGAIVSNELIKNGLMEQFGLSEQQVTRIMRDVLPHGVSELKLSDACQEVSAMQCTPVNGAIRIDLAPRREL